MKLRAPQPWQIELGHLVATRNALRMARGDELGTLAVIALMFAAIGLGAYLSI